MSFLSLGTIFSQPTFNWSDLKSTYLINQPMNFNYFLETEGKFVLELRRVGYGNTLLDTFVVSGIGSGVITYKPTEKRDDVYFILKNYGITDSISPHFKFVYGSVSINSPKIHSPLNYQHRFLLSLEVENTQLPIDIYFSYDGSSTRNYIYTFPVNGPYEREILLNHFCNTLTISAYANGLTNPSARLDQVQNIPVGHNGIDSIVQKLRDENLSLQEELDLCGSEKLILKEEKRTRDSVIAYLENNNILLNDSINWLNERILILKNNVSNLEEQISQLTETNKDLTETLNDTINYFQNIINSLNIVINDLNSQIHESFNITIYDIPMSVEIKYNFNKIPDKGLYYLGDLLEFEFNNYNVFNMFGETVLFGQGDNVILDLDHSNLQMPSGTYFLYLREKQELYKFNFIR